MFDEYGIKINFFYGEAQLVNNFYIESLKSG